MSGVSSAEELSTTGLIILQKWFDEGSAVHREPIAFPPTVSLGLLMMTQSMEVEVVCHRVVALHLCRGWNRMAVHILLVGYSKRRRLRGVILVCFLRL